MGISVWNGYKDEIIKDNYIENSLTLWLRQVQGPLHLNMEM